MSTFTSEVFYGTNHSSFDAVVALRHRCWQSVLSKLSGLDDGHDDHSIHFLIWNDGRLIVSGRLCLHNLLYEVVEPHLYLNLDTESFPAPWGCMCRLVIDMPFRGKGFSEFLDHFRMLIASDLNCSTMLGSWTPKSGMLRRDKLFSQGYVSCSDNRLIADGEFGESMPLAKLITDTTKTDKHSTDIFPIDIEKINRMFNQQLLELAASHPFPSID